MAQNIFKFFNNIYADNKYRIKGKRHITQDVLRYFKNIFLHHFVEKRLIRQYYDTSIPVIFILGVPRSGTTLLAQYLVKNFPFGFINNAMARYWLAPLHGAKAYKARNPQTETSSLQSFLGNTFRENDPHEFGYFWQYWMENDDHDEPHPGIKWHKIKAELQALAGYFQHKLMIKSIFYNNYQITELHKHFPNALFIHMKRDPAFTIQSIYEARLQRYGNPEIWWSIRPKDYRQIQKNYPPIEQITYQYFYTLEKIEKGLQTVPRENQVTINYEDFTNNPEQVKETLRHFLEEKVFPVKTGNLVIKNANQWRVDPKIKEEIKETIKRYPRFLHENSRYTT